MVTNLAVGAEFIDLLFKAVGWIAIVIAVVYTLFLINTWVRYSFNGLGIATLGVHGVVMFVTISTLLSLMATL